MNAPGEKTKKKKVPDFSRTFLGWWLQQDSNLWPHRCERCALPIRSHRQISIQGYTPSRPVEIRVSGTSASLFRGTRLRYTTIHSQGYTCTPCTVPDSVSQKCQSDGQRKKQIGLTRLLLVKILSLEFGNMRNQKIKRS